MKWKKESKGVEKALKNEIQQRLKQLSAKNPNGFGSLSMVNNMNTNPNSSTVVTSSGQRRGSHSFAPSHNGGFELPGLLNQAPLKRSYYTNWCP